MTSKVELTGIERPRQMIAVSFERNIHMATQILREILPMTSLEEQ
jgi:hypothetical protein